MDYGYLINVKASFTEEGDEEDEQRIEHWCVSARLLNSRITLEKASRPLYSLLLPKDVESMICHANHPVKGKFEVNVSPSTSLVVNTVVKYLPSTKPQPPSSSTQHREFWQDMLEKLDNETDSDLTITTSLDKKHDEGDLVPFSESSDIEQVHVFHVHRFMLMARSPVFQKMLSSGMKEDKQAKINLETFTRRDVRIFLEILYLDRIVSKEAWQDWDIVKRVYVLCDQYLVHKWADICADRLLDLLTLENACDIFCLTRGLTSARMEHMGKCIFRFILSHISQIRKTPTYQALIKTVPGFSEEIVDAVVGERNSVVGEKRRKLDCP